MTGEQWDVSTDPREMMTFLRLVASDRKLRLVAIACTRRLQHWFFVRAIRDALDLAERHADGLISREEMDAARAALRAVGGVHGLFAGYAVSDSISAFDAAWACVCGVANQRELVCDLIRDIFNPYRSAALDPAWLAWHDGLPVVMAHTMYLARDFADMPVLGDALEEAGCTEADILNHCRQPGEHVRGCWVIDFLLGKE